MIVSASYRTDIPAFYGQWFGRRLAAGSCRVSNPYGGPASEVSLRPADVDGFLFWTRNAGPFLETLGQVAHQGSPFVVQYTLTGYPRALEPAVPGRQTSLQAMAAISRTYGQRSLVWRYDPILITSLTPPAWHRANFADLARGLVGITDEVVLSFAHIYAKTRANTERAAAQHGFSWCDPDPSEKRELLIDLAAIGHEQGLSVSLCSQPDLLGPGLAAARCIDVARLSDLAGRALKGRTKGNRPGCLCAESRDIGAYDSCPQGCVYCYAVLRPDHAIGRLRAHDPDSPFLIAPKARSAAQAEVST